MSSSDIFGTLKGGCPSCGEDLEYHYYALSCSYAPPSRGCSCQSCGFFQDGWPESIRTHVEEERKKEQEWWERERVEGPKREKRNRKRRKKRRIEKFRERMVAAVRGCSDPDPVCVEWCRVICDILETQDPELMIFGSGGSEGRVI